MLARGAEGKRVEALQKMLMAHGINPGPIDGLFGPKTEAAVRRFQEKAGLQVDGIVGPHTRKALQPQVQAAPAPKPPAPKPLNPKPPAPKPLNPTSK